jgi:hypothetical protein
MRGAPPLQLFTTLARDRRLFGKFFDAGLLDRGHLTLRQRELVIHRTTARCCACATRSTRTARSTMRSGPRCTLASATRRCSSC